MALPKYCPTCGQRVAMTAHSVGICSACSREVYANSRPTAGVLLVRDGQVLLVRRARDPRKGMWDIPGGFLLEGEPPEDGARRELREELGLEIEAEELQLVLTSITQWEDFAVLDILFEAAMPEQEPSPASDVESCAWFPIDRPPTEMAFDGSRTSLERWRHLRSSGEGTRSGSSADSPSGRAGEESD